MTDLEIEKGCKQGDNKARKELYIRYSGLMFALIMRYVGDKEQSEDLLHDGFISVFGSFDKFVWRGEGSLRAWMSRLFVNVALGWLRDKKDFEVSVDEIPQLRVRRLRRRRGLRPDVGLVRVQRHGLLSRGSGVGRVCGRQSAVR